MHPCFKRILYQVPEMASVIRFRDDVYIVPVLEYIIQPLYSRVVEGPEEVELALDLFQRATRVPFVVTLYHAWQTG